jgi:hypothetical protein
MLFTHTDVHEGKQGLTALWYVAPEWNVEWGGETMLYNRDQDAVACVTPRPGRLVVFDGTILHAGASVQPHLLRPALHAGVQAGAAADLSCARRFRIPESAVAPARVARNPSSVPPSACSPVGAPATGWLC